MEHLRHTLESVGQLRAAGLLTMDEAAALKAEAMQEYAAARYGAKLALRCAAADGVRRERVVCV